MICENSNGNKYQRLMSFFGVQNFRSEQFEDSAAVPTLIVP